MAKKDGTGDGKHRESDSERTQPLEKYQPIIDRWFSGDQPGGDDDAAGSDR
jgi:hypothetical protein